jgi:Zn-dependent protease/predicted transcriptional regulator
VVLPTIGFAQIMSWSFRIGRLFGIDVFVHATFLLLPLWLGVSEYNRTKDWTTAMLSALFVLPVFAIIVMHEYGHALTARLFGVKTRDIILLPIGGMARLESIPQKPWQELLIAIAGPAVNVVLAVLCLVAIVASGIWTAVQTPDLEDRRDAVQAFFNSSWAVKLFVVNVSLVIFNMIPAFPMDGGRVLRSVLAMMLDYVRATWIAARIGQGVAVLLGILGIYLPDYFLVFLALMVFMGAAQEAKMVSVRAALTGATVRQAMATNFLTLNPFDTLEAAALKFAMTPQMVFPVLHGDALVGMIGRNEIASLLSKHGPQRHISEFMQREVQAVRPDAPLMGLLPLLQSGQALAVLEGDELVGVVSAADVMAHMGRAR